MECRKLDSYKTEQVYQEELTEELIFFGGFIIVYVNAGISYDTDSMRLWIHPLITMEK